MEATRPFEELVRRLQRPLFGFLVVRVGNVAEAEELVQEAFLRAWSKLDRYDSRWRFSTWLFTVAKRLAVSRARARRPDVVNRVELGEEAVQGLSEGSDPAEHAAEREELAGLWRLAAHLLPVDQRSALWLRYAEGLSNEEIAGILGRPRVTVRVLLFRAREALGRELRAREARGRRAAERRSRRRAVPDLSLALPEGSPGELDPVRVADTRAGAPGRAGTRTWAGNLASPHAGPSRCSQPQCSQRLGPNRQHRGAPVPSPCNGESP